MRITLSGGRQLPDVTIPLSKTAVTVASVRLPQASTTTVQATTTIAPTTTLGANDCRVSYRGIQLTLCAPVKTWEYDLYDDTKFLGDGPSGEVYSTNINVLVVREKQEVTRLRVRVKFRNGAELWNVFIPVRPGSDAVVQFTKSPDK